MTKVLQPRREVLFSYWFNRFQVFDGGVSHYQCRDWLRPEAQVLPKSRIAELAADDVSTVVFQHGFVKAWESTFPKPVASRPAGPDDLLFWQFPCRTEAAAFDLHEQLVEPGFASGEVHCYVGLPWATWIDKHRVDENQAEAHRQVRLVATES